MWQGDTKATSIDNRVEYICEPKEASGRGCHCVPPKCIWRALCWGSSLNAWYNRERLKCLALFNHCNLICASAALPLGSKRHWEFLWLLRCCSWGFQHVNPPWNCKCFLLHKQFCTEPCTGDSKICPRSSYTGCCWKAIWGGVLSPCQYSWVLCEGCIGEAGIGSQLVCRHAVQNGIWDWRFFPNQLVYGNYLSCPTSRSTTLAQISMACVAGSCLSSLFRDW